jgi:dihydrofolate synthase/folylpolyglutamate synthase
MNREAAYDGALDYLYSFVDYSLKHISELAKADFNLDRMVALMEELGNPQERYAILHVAGTKGKGSVCALAAAALTGAGYKTGLYTSPHLVEYVERVQVDAEPITHAELVQLVEAVKPAVARIPKLTTFEITTAIGLLAFQRAGVNAAVVEVGLGGRLDATNIVTPRVSAITSLSYDHTLVLGDTLAKIAGEKAGIIKRGVPVVSAPQKAEALEVLEHKAGGQNARLTLVGRDVAFESVAHSLDGQRISLWPAGRYLAEASVRPAAIEVEIPLLGPRQVENAAVATAALWELVAQGLDIPNAAIQKGFAQVQWPGRFEVMRRDPPVVIDSAHNRDSASHLRQALDVYFPGQPVILLFSALEDKDISGMLEELRPRAERVVATRVDHPRAPAVEWIAEQVRQAGIPAEGVTPARAALERALQLAGKRAVVLVAGSVAFAGEMRQAWFQLENQQPAGRA